jgi:hypothetical protein
LTPRRGPAKKNGPKPEERALRQAIDRRARPKNVPPSASSRENNPKLGRERLRAYFAGLPPDRRRALKKLREAIRAAVPGAAEVISYGIPAFRLEGRMLVWYAAWKKR